MFSETSLQTTFGIDSVHPTRDRVARYLMLALSVATIGAFANAAVEFRALPDDRLVVGTWQLLGFVVFAGLFALLALWPRRMPGIWELILFHKIGVTVINAGFIGSVSGPMPSDDPLGVVLIDGALVAVTLLCYWLTKGWRAWVTAQA